VAKGALTPRRAPAPADRYRHAVRQARARLPQRRRLPVAAAVLGWAILLAGAGTMAVRAAGGLSAVAGDLGSFVAGLVPPATAGDLTVADVTGPVAAAPIFDAVPEFTAVPSLLVQGRIPAFVLAQGRSLEVTLNSGASVATPIDGNGHFAITLALRDGPNLIVATLLKDRGVIATSAKTVIVDRLPPTLGVVAPKPGDVIDGPNVVVEGKVEPGATVMVNERSVVVGVDGSFTESFTAPSGPLAIRVIARDRAGNETKVEAAVVVRDRPTAGARTLLVALDRTTVKPGGLVTATITLSDPFGPRTDASVSLSVGVVSIGVARTDKLGTARISFAAPPNEGVAQVVVLADGASASAVLTVAK